MPFVKEGCCLLSRMLFVERGCRLLREDTIRQDKDTVCQRGMEDTVSRRGRMLFVEDKLKNVVGRKNNKFPRWEIQSST